MRTALAVPGATQPYGYSAPYSWSPATPSAATASATEPAEPAVLPVLWIITWVRRDRLTLHEWGHLRRAHWAWAFLGAVGYLFARTLVVRRQATGRGWWPLLLNLTLTAILLNIWFLTPLFSLIRVAAL